MNELEKIANRRAWVQAYATILAGLLANPTTRSNWDDLRERARIETNTAFNLGRDTR